MKEVIAHKEKRAYDSSLRLIIVKNQNYSASLISVIGLNQRTRRQSKKKSKVADDRNLVHSEQTKIFCYYCKSKIRLFPKLFNMSPTRYIDIDIQMYIYITTAMLLACTVQVFFVEIYTYKIYIGYDKPRSFC